jgi:hypothetical protein
LCSVEFCSSDEDELDIEEDFNIDDAADDDDDDDDDSDENRKVLVKKLEKIGFQSYLSSTLGGSKSESAIKTACNRVVR